MEEKHSIGSLDTGMRVRKSAEISEETCYSLSIIPFVRDYVQNYEITHLETGATDGVVLSEKEYQKFVGMDENELYGIIKDEKTTLGELMEEKDVNGKLFLEREGREELLLVDTERSYVNPEGTNLIETLEREDVGYKVSCEDGLLEKAYMEIKPSSYEDLVDNRVKYNDIVAEEDVKLTPGLGEKE